LEQDFSPQRRKGRKAVIVSAGAASAANNAKDAKDFYM
jgi:hypothetical protein